MKTTARFKKTFEIGGTVPHPESVGDHVAAFEGAVEQISGQFLQQSAAGAKGNVFDGPPVLLHPLHYL